MVLTYLVGERVAGEDSVDDVEALVGQGQADGRGHQQVVHQSRGGATATGERVGQLHEEERKGGRW